MRVTPDATALAVGVATALSVVLAVSAPALTADRVAEAWLQGYVPATLHRIAFALDMGARATLAAAIIAALVVDGRRWVAAGVGIVRIASGAFLGELLKTACERLRPSALPAMTSGNSLPSGHIMNTTLVAVVAWELADGLTPRWRRTARAAAVLAVAAQACARVLHGSHWPSDIAPSVLLGITWMLVAGRLWEARRWRVPALAAAGLAYVLFLHVPALRVHVVSVLDRPRSAVAAWDADRALMPTTGAPATPVSDPEARTWSVTLESPTATPDTVELVLGARCDRTHDRCRRVQLSVNGARALDLPLHCGWHWYAADASTVALHRGANTVALDAPAGCPRPDLAVQSVALVVEREPPGATAALVAVAPHA